MTDEKILPMMPSKREFAYWHIGAAPCGPRTFLRIRDELGPLLVPDEIEVIGLDRNGERIFRLRADS